MATYFDNREQQEKTIPDCSKAGLTWNPETQRCERMSTINSILMAANLLTRVPQQPVQNTGMGYLQYDPYWDEYYDDGYGYSGWDDYGYYDFATDNYTWDGDLPYYAPPSFDWDLSDYRDITGNLDDSGIDWASYWDSYFSGGDLYIPSPGDYQFTGDFASGSSGNNDPWLPENFWDWLGDFGDVGDTVIDMIPVNPPYPGYCPQGTYHPINDPYSCVPFPPNDPAFKNQQKQAQQAAQKAAQAIKAAQQKKDQACPKDPQGRPVWFNPQTGRCELKPNCPQGTTFDSSSRRCLTPAQAKELYGDNNWLLWLLIAAGVIVVIKK